MWILGQSVNIVLVPLHGYSYDLRERLSAQWNDQECARAVLAHFLDFRRTMGAAPHLLPIEAFRRASIEKWQKA
jgi:hypothetical protein